MSNRQPSVIDVIESFLLGISCLVGGDQFYLLISHTGLPITSQYIVLIITILVTFIATLICDRTSDLSINGAHSLYMLLLSALIVFVKQRIKSLLITSVTTFALGVTLTYLILQACTRYSRSRRLLQLFLLGLFSSRVFPSFIWYLVRRRFMEYQLQMYSVSLTLVIFRFSACLTSMLIKISRKKFGFSNKQPKVLFHHPNSYITLAGNSIFLNFCKKVRLCLFPVAVFFISIALYLTFPPTMMAKHFNYSPNFISSINLMEMTFHLFGSCFGFAYPVSSTGNEPGFYFMTLFLFILYLNSLFMFYYSGTMFPHHFMYVLVMVSGFSLGYLWSYTLYIVFNTTMKETCILKEHLHIHCCCDVFYSECYCRHSKFLNNMYSYFKYPVMNRFLCYKPDGIPTYKYDREGTHAIILCHPGVDVYSFFSRKFCDFSDCSYLYLVGIFMLESVTTSTCCNCQLTVRLEGSKILIPENTPCSDIVSSGGLLGSECSKFCLSVKCCPFCSSDDEIKFRSCRRCNSVCKAIYVPQKTCENPQCQYIPGSCDCPSPFTQPTRLYYCFTSKGQNFFREIGPYSIPAFDGDLKFQNDFYIKNVDISNCCHSDLKIDLHCGMKNNFFRLSQIEYKNKSLRVDTLKLISMPIELSQEESKKSEKVVSDSKSQVQESQKLETQNLESQVSPLILTVPSSTDSSSHSSPEEKLESPPKPSHSQPLTSDYGDSPSHDVSEPSSGPQTSSSDSGSPTSEVVSESAPAPQALTLDDGVSYSSSSDSQAVDNSPSDVGQSVSHSEDSSTDFGSHSPPDDTIPSDKSPPSEENPTSEDSSSSDPQPPLEEKSDSDPSHSVVTPPLDPSSSDETPPSVPQPPPVERPSSEGNPLSVPDLHSEDSPPSGPSSSDETTRSDPSSLDDSKQSVLSPVDPSTSPDTSSTDNSPVDVLVSPSPSSAHSQSPSSDPLGSSSADNSSDDSVGQPSLEKLNGDSSTSSDMSLQSSDNPRTPDSISGDSSASSDSPLQSSDSSLDSTGPTVEDSSPSAIPSPSHDPPSEIPPTEVSGPQNFEDASHSPDNVELPPGDKVSETEDSQLSLSSIDGDQGSTSEDPKSILMGEVNPAQREGGSEEPSESLPKTDSEHSSTSDSFPKPDSGERTSISDESSDPLPKSDSGDKSSTSDSPSAPGDSDFRYSKDSNHLSSTLSSPPPASPPSLPSDLSEKIAVGCLLKNVNSDLEKVDTSSESGDSNSSDSSSDSDSDFEPEDLSSKDKDNSKSVTDPLCVQVVQDDNKDVSVDKPSPDQTVDGSGDSPKDSSSVGEEGSSVSPPVSQVPDDSSTGSDQGQQSPSTSSVSEGPGSEESPSGETSDLKVGKSTDSPDDSHLDEGSPEGQKSEDLEPGSPHPSSVDLKSGVSPSEESPPKDLFDKSSNDSNLSSSGEPAPLSKQSSESPDDKDLNVSSGQSLPLGSSGSTEETESTVSTGLPSPAPLTTPELQVASSTSTPKKDKCQCLNSRLSKLTVTYRLVNNPDYMLDDLFEMKRKQELTRAEDTCNYSDECKPSFDCCLVCTLNVDSVSSFIKRIDTVRVRLVCISFLILGLVCLSLILCVFGLRHSKVEPFIFDPVISFKELMNRREIYKLNSSGHIKRILDQSLKFSGTKQLKKTELDQMQRLFQWILEKEDYHSLLGYIRTSADEFLKKDGRKLKIDTVRWCISSGFIYAYLAMIFKPIQKFFAYWEELWQGEYSDYRRLMSPFINKIANKSKFALSLLSEVKMTEQGINLINRTRLVTWNEVLDELKRYTELYHEESNLIESGIPLKFDLRLHHYLDRWNHRIEHIKYLTDSQRSVFDWKPFLVYYENFSVWFDYFSVFIERFVEIISLPINELKKNTSVFANYKI